MIAGILARILRIKFGDEVALTIVRVIVTENRPMVAHFERSVAMLFSGIGEICVHRGDVAAR